MLDLLYQNNSNLDEFQNVVHHIELLQKESSYLLEIKYHGTQNKLGNLITMKEKEINQNLLTSYLELKNQIVLIQKILRQNNIPNIDLSKIITFINDFSKYILISDELIINEIYTQNLCILNKQNTMNLSLKSGRKIILKNRNFDLEDFTYDELIEILRVLDILIKSDEFNYLRTKLTEQLANISSISFVE